MPRWPSREFANRIKPRAGTKKKKQKKIGKKKGKKREEICEREDPPFREDQSARNFHLPPTAFRR